MNNSQKIFDIIPPDRPGNPSRAIFKKPEIIRKTIKTPTEATPEVKIKSSPIKKLFFVFFGILLIFIVLAQFVFANANIRIVPQNQTLDFEEKITVNIGKSAIDASEKQIPGKIIQEEASAAKEFPSSGTAVKEEKASGKIKVYNNYSTASQVLVANTRFISSDGKLFRTIQRVTIPGGIYDSKGKLQSGTLDVDVVADQPGTDYNIGPDTFSIPGFVGTPKYTAFYGKSSGPMAGGYRGEAKQVTKGDLENARTAIINDLLKTGAASLKEKMPQEYALSFSEDGLYHEILETSSSVEEGDEKDSFVYSVKIKLSFLAFRQTDLETLAKESIGMKMEKNQRFYEQSLKIDSDVDSVNMGAGTERLNLKVSGKIYSDIGEFQLKESLQGKTVKDAQILLENTPQVEQVQVSVWPFWASRIPKDVSKVKITLILD